MRPSARTEDADTPSPAMLPVNGAGPRVEARRNAGIRDHVELVADQQW
jgi:hypothetical protein